MTVTPTPARVAKTNTLAIISLVLGFVIPIAAIVTGPIAMSQIKRTGESGRGLALAGLIIGCVATAFWILMMIISIVVAISASQSTTY